jgi:hypothetical protein
MCWSAITRLIIHAGMFDHWLDAQVQASLGTMHKAIDRAVSIHNNRANRRSDTGRDRCAANAAAGDPDSDALQGPAAALEARSILAPVPAAADLVFSAAP